MLNNPAGIWYPNQGQRLYCLLYGNSRRLPLLRPTFLPHRPNDLASPPLIVLTLAQT